MASESALVGIDATLPVVVRIGRPPVDRDEARLLFEARLYSDAQIARALTCSTKTVGRIRKELIESGDLVVEGRAKSFDKREADFDAECFRAKGTSFKEWIVGKRSKAGGMRVYRHCRLVWSSPDFWDKPSLVRVMDAKDRLADQLAEKWLKRFATKEEKASLRDRLNYIRPLFEWLRRPEINDEFFYVSASRARALRYLYTERIYLFEVSDIVSKGEGSIQISNGKTWIYLPKSLAEDSAFPFKKGDKVSIEIKEGYLTVFSLKSKLKR